MRRRAWPRPPVVATVGAWPGHWNAHWQRWKRKTSPLCGRSVSKMSEPKARDGDGWDAGFDGHQRRQARLGLSMTPAERLAWLECKLAEMRELLGKAQTAERNDEPSGAER